MADNSCTNFCTPPLSPNATSDQGCDCAPVARQSKSKTPKYFASFVTLCAIGCAVPPILAALGLIGIATGAYLSSGIEVLLIILALLGLGALLMKFVKKKR